MRPSTLRNDTLRWRIVLRWWSLQQRTIHPRWRRNDRPWPRPISGVRNNIRADGAWPNMPVHVRPAMNVPHHNSRVISFPCFVYRGGCDILTRPPRRAIFFGPSWCENGGRSHSCDHLVTCRRALFSLLVAIEWVCFPVPCPE